MTDLSQYAFALSPKKRALLDLLLQRAGVDRLPSQIPRRLDNAPCSLSFAQERLWFLHQLVPDNPFYNVDIAIRLPFVPDLAILQATLDEIVRRHHILRTTFAV